MRLVFPAIVAAASLANHSTMVLAGGILFAVGQPKMMLAFASSSSSSSNPSLRKGKNAEQQPTQTTKKKNGMTVLRFGASIDYKTQPAPLTDKNRLRDFLVRDDHRDILFTGRDNQNQVQLYLDDNDRSSSSSLYHIWATEAAKYGNAKPNFGRDTILQVTTAGIRFPGLTVRNVAAVGYKKVNSPTGPELQTTLLRDELQAQGPRPLVWVFNKLTGSGGNNDNNDNNGEPPSSADPEQQRKTHSTNRITVECNNDGVVFRSKAQLIVEVSFPSILLKLLPVSKQTAERQCSEGISKVVERDVGPALERLRQRYVDWLRTAQTNGAHHHHPQEKPQHSSFNSTNTDETVEKI